MAVSEATGRVPSGCTDRVRGVVAGLGLETRLAGLPGDGELLGRMGSDKKTRGGRIRLVLPVDGRGVELVDVDDTSVITAGWDAIREG